MSKILDFSEALYELKKGKKVARLPWTETDKRYLAIYDERIMLWINDEPCMLFSDSRDIDDSLLAQDWKVIDCT